MLADAPSVRWYFAATWPTASTLDGVPVQSAAHDYDDFAEVFAVETEPNLLNRYYVRPAVLDLAGDAAGRRILDIGCGTPCLPWLRLSVPCLSSGLDELGRLVSAFES